VHTDLAHASCVAHRPAESWEIRPQTSSSRGYVAPLECKKTFFSSAPDPAGGAYSAPPGPRAGGEGAGCPSPRTLPQLWASSFSPSGLVRGPCQHDGLDAPTAWRCACNGSQCSAVQASCNNATDVVCIIQSRASDPLMTRRSAQPYATRKTIRYDTKCYFNMRSKADTISQANLSQRTKTKNWGKN